MRTPLVVACSIVVVALGAASAAGGGREDDDRKLNVVVLMTDDQTADSLRVMPRTRALLADRGTTFERAFASYPLCCPSRATFLTGQLPHNHGVLGNRPPNGGYGALRDRANTLPGWLRAAGYDTIHIGKYLNGYGRDEGATVPPGWTDWHGSVDPSTYLMWGYRLNENGTIRQYGRPNVENPALYQTDVYREKAVQAIRTRAGGDEPFLLSVAFLAPHSEARGQRRAGQPSVRSAPRHRGSLAGEPIPRAPSYDEADLSDKPAFMGAFARLNARRQARIVADERSRLESLLAVDEAVEAIVGALREAGELDETLILFTADNGFFAGQHRVPSGKYLVYEPSVRVPLVVRGPGIPAGGTSRELSSNVDLAATIVDAAGADARRRLDGRSLLPFARRPSRETDRALLLETAQTAENGDLDQDGGPLGGGRDIPTYRAVRTDRYKYVEHSTGDRELYDLRADPDELRSVHADARYARTLAALRRELRRLRRCRGAACRREASRVPSPRAARDR